MGKQPQPPTPTPPSRAGVLGRQGASSSLVLPRSQRHCFVCIQIPGAGGGESPQYRETWTGSWLGTFVLG